SDAFVLSGGSLSFAAASAINNTLNVSGTLTGAGQLDVSGLLTWSGGTMAGTGVTNANGGLTWNGAATLDTRTFNNAGAAVVTVGGVFSNGAVFNNLAGATFDDRANATFSQVGSATVSFNNAGTFTRSVGTGTASFSRIAFNNSGTTQVQTGTLDLSGGG